MVNSLEVDNTKAIALPIFFILALLLAMFITRKTLANAFPRAKSELRLGILYFGGIICTVLSVFLFPTAGWQYGVVSALFCYCFALSCAPGIIEKRAHAIFVATASWYAVMLGIPSKWSKGIVESISGCNGWFPAKPGMCSESWLAFATFVAIAEIIVFFFMILVLMSFAFDQVLAQAKNEEVNKNNIQNNNNNNNNNNGDYSAPLSSNRQGSLSARGDNVTIYAPGSN